MDQEGHKEIRVLRVLVDYLEQQDQQVCNNNSNDQIIIPSMFFMAFIIYLL